MIYSNDLVIIYNRKFQKTTVRGIFLCKRRNGYNHSDETYQITETDTDDFEREYVRLPSGITGLAAATERHCLSPKGEFQREWRRISARRFTGNAT